MSKLSPKSLLALFCFVWLVVFSSYQSYAQNDIVLYDLAVHFGRNNPPGTSLSIQNVVVTIDGSTSYGSTYFPNGINPNNTMYVRNISGNTPTSVRISGQVTDRRANGATSTVNFNELFGPCGGGKTLQLNPIITVSVSISSLRLAAPRAQTGFPPGAYCASEPVSFSVTNLGQYSFYEIEAGVANGDGTYSFFTNSNPTRVSSGVNTSYNGVISFTIKDILGSNYAAFLGREIFFRARSDNNNLCGNINYLGIESNLTAPYRFYPDPPSIVSATGIAPTCPDGQGSIQIVHGDQTPRNTTFTYTVTQYLRATDGACRSDYGPVGNNTVNQSVINGTIPVCGGSSTINIGSNTYCSGFIGNYERTFYDATQLTYTLNETNSIQGTGAISGNTLRLYPGIYRVEVEAKTNPNGLNCVCAYFVEIPKSSYITPSISDPTLEQRPSCIGGSDGALRFTVNNGLAPYSWDVVRLSSPSTLISTGGNTTSFATDLALQYSNSNSYQVKLDDACLSSSITKDFRLDTDGISLLQLGSTASQTSSSITCYDDNGFGNAYWQVEVTGSRPSQTTGYRYSLFKGSGLSQPVTNSQNRGDGLNYQFSSLGLDTYTVKVDAPNGCSNTITKNDFVLPQSLNGTFTIEATCTNSNTGRIIFNKTTGQGNLNFEMNGSPVVPTISGNSYIIAGLASGAKNIIVRDDCLTPNEAGIVGQITNNQTIGIINQLAMDDSPSGGPTDTNVVNGQTISLSCYNATYDAFLSYVNGKSPYSVSVTRNNISFNGFAHTAGSLVSLPDLTAGTYSVVITDACGDQLTRSFTITTPPTITRSISLNNLSCANNQTGQIEVTAGGGTPGNYVIKLFNGATELTSNTEACGTGCRRFKNLSENIPYLVEISDANGCIRRFDQTSELISLTAPLPLTISTPNFATDLDNEVLFGGDVYVRCKDDASITYRTTITAGNAPYQVNLLRNSTNNFPVGLTALQSEVVSNSGGVASFENLGAGWYKVLVSDAQNCAYNEVIFEIKEAMSLPEVATVQRRAYAHGFNTICYGDATGAITINATGGLAQGDYTYVLSASDGSADRLVSKTISDPDYTFENLPALTGTGDAIVYSVALRDALGCQWTNTNGVSTDYELQPPAPVTYNWKILTPTQDGYEILCRGDAATILVQSNGGKFPHSVSLGGTTLVLSHATDSVLFDLTAGNYVLNIVDDSENGGCSAGEPIELTEPGSAVSLSIDNLVAPVCIGGTDGRVEVSGSNGSPSGVAGEAYAFLIRTTGALTFDTDTLRGTAVNFLRPANGYTGQSYDVLVLDQYGCTAQQSAVLPANATPLTLSTTSLIAPSCYGATNGSISLTASNADLINGTDLIFRLSGGHLGNTISSVQVSSLTQTFNNLSGTDINNYSPYRAWVEDVHACTDSADQYLPTLVLISPSEVNINLVESIRPTCYNGADGSLLVAITGGVGPYQYSSDNISYTTVSASNVIGTTALLADDYTYYIRDAQYDPNQPTCQRQAVFTVNHGRQLQLNGVLENVSCKGGTDGSIALTVQVNNLNVGAGEVQDNSRLSYSWSNTNLSSLPISSSEDLNNLRRGTYTLVARYDADSTICQNSRSFSILEPESTFRISEVRTYTSGCGGGADGRALVSIAGGWSNTLNEYSLDGASWQPVASNSFLLNNLSPGVHEVRVRQHGTCESIETFTIEAASLPLSIVSSINPQCPQGSDGSLLVSSSDGDVEYSLDGINYQTATVFSGLPASSYTIRARRISNPLCQSTSIVVNLIDPVDCGNGVLMLNAGSVTAATCAASVDGSAQVLASGGVPPYRYYWNGSSVAGTSLQSLSGGAHSVTVKDAVEATATLAIVVPLQAPLSATIISNPGSCADSCDGSINLLVSGGSGNYTYQWSDNQTTADRMNLCAGSYTVTISDATSALCTLEKTAVVSSQPPIVVTAASIVAPACAGGNDGSINVVATGGSGNYSYSWSNGNTGTALSAAAGDYTVTLIDQVLGCSTISSFTIPEGSSVGVTTAVSIPSCVGGGDGRIQLSTTSLITPLVQWSTGQIGLQATGLSAGTYNYILTDAMGCVQSSSVVVSDPIALQITSTQNNLSCAGQCSGSIALSITGGSAPYQVLWSTGSRSSSLQNLCAGTYSYQVRDNKGCVQTGSVTIQSPAALSIITTPTHPSCYRSSDGIVLASVTGGSGAYTYSWTRLTSTTVLSSTQTLSNVNAGAYRIQIQDERGCQRSATVTLVDPLPISLVNDKQTMPSCNGLSDGGIEVITSGGTAPYNYNWQDGASTSVRSNLAAGSYRVEVMDAKGCRLEKTYTLTAPAALSLINVLSSDPNCFGDSNGSISLSASGGSAPYRYSWSNGSTTSSLSNLMSGSYSVVITDSKQCTLSSTFTLTAPTQLMINGIDPEYVICTGSKAVISPAGNWSSYSWSGPQSFKSTAARIETGVSGAYQLLVKDTRGCEASRSFSVNVSASALLADFLRISEALVYNPIVLVDISVPLPDKITWLLPEDGDILVNQQAGSMLELVFTRAGAYEVGLKAELGQCSAELYKVIVIEAGNGRTESVDEAEQERLATPLQTLIYPNPAKDELQLNVQAPEREQVVVSLISALDGAVLKTETYEGQLDYLQRWSIELVKPGTYYILTQQKNKITARKIVVVK